VTGFTEGHEIVLLIAAAFGERKDVVYLFGRSELTLFLTLFTERMRLDVAVTDTLPSTTVSLVGSRVTFVLIVMFVHCLFMLGTVLPAFSKPTAAGVSTRTLWFVRHRFTSLSGHKKSPCRVDPAKAIGTYFVFSHSTLLFYSKSVL
jgi:hypothetical protein